MRQPGSRRRRNPEQELQERERYDFLERLYALTGDDCEVGADLDELERELGLTPRRVAPVSRDLEVLGYVARTHDGARLCLTQRGIRFVRRGAWRRRSVRA